MTSLNHHLETTLPDGRPAFVKVYADPGNARVERAVLDALAARYDWPVTAVDGGRGWLAFPLLDVRPATDLRMLGALLADVHTCPPPPGLATMPRGVDAVPSRLARLGDASAVATWERATAIRRDAEAYTTPDVLLHNDFGLRNAVVRPDGVMALIDFERSETGDPHWDLGKTWDAELVGSRETFVDGYGGMPWLHETTLWCTRFAAALAAVSYAMKVGDTTFAAWGRDLLRTLDGEV